MKASDIMVAGEAILQIHGEYLKSLLWVNRTYQRKLVWTLAEKQALIDTILLAYPIPLFLFVSRSEINQDGVNVATREVIDGLQRLEAIVSFINNRFPVMFEGQLKYFNQQAIWGESYLKDHLGVVQKYPALTRDQSMDFLSYRLAVTTIRADEVCVEDVFKRINSTGRQLSAQNLRQAGVVGTFSSMVQDIATILRGDSTKSPIVRLSDMEKLSLSDEGLHYGLDARKIFWTAQGIISDDGLRRSKDEEIIAGICNCVLHNYKTGISKHTLDRIYDPTGKAYKENERLLTDARQAWLTSLVTGVFDDFIKLFSLKNITFEKLVTSEDRCRNKDLVFIVLFLAITQLKQEGYIFDSYDKLFDVLYLIADKDLSDLVGKSDGTWNIGNREFLVERVKNRIKPCMSFSSSKPEWDEEFYSLLGKAVSEEQMYDFKLGITNLTDGTCNTALIEKCVKTLVAMANTRPREYGYVVLGIADNESTCKDFEQHYCKHCLKYNNLYVTGIEAEAVRYYGSVDIYMQKLKSLISACKDETNANIIHRILTEIKLVKYGDKSIAVLRLAADRPLVYKGHMYVRYQSSVKDIVLGSEEFYTVLSAFNIGGTESSGVTHIFN